MRYFLGFLAFFATFLLMAAINSAWSEWGLLAIIDIPSLFPILFMNGAVIVATGSFKLSIKSANAIFSQKYKLSDEDKEKSVELYKLLARTTMYSAGISTLMGILFMLGQIDTPDTIGPMLSISLISMVYGIFINAIFFWPGIFILKNRKNPGQTVTINEKMVLNKMLEMCYKQGITPEEILNADKIKFD